MENLASRIDHTLLRAGATAQEVERLCAEAVEHGFAAVCVGSGHVQRCAARLKGTSVHVASVVGFPLGHEAARVRTFEARCAVEDGATELDLVLALGALLTGDLTAVERDLADVVKAAQGIPVKAILETCLLDDTQKRTACRIAEQAGAAYVKTSTGFGSGGANVADVQLLRASVGPQVRVKASGGIRHLGLAQELLAAGADRLGTSSGVALVLAAQN